ncbi:MAG: MBL fold metallo-hydrolase, partial [Bacillota bacterium]
MIIERVSVGELEANCYIVACKSTRKAIVIDPGDEGPKIADYIDANGYHLEALVATHG